MKKFTLLASLLTLGISTAQAIVIPDLFGSYQKGVEAARQANSQMPQTGYYLMVVNPSTRTSYSSMNVSLKRGDYLCWTVYPITPRQTYQVKETFSVPQTSAYDTSVKFGGVVLTSEYNQYLKGGQRSSGSQIFDFYRTAYAADYQIDGCWSFDPATTTQGYYSLYLTVGSTRFAEHKFRIVD